MRVLLDACVLYPTVMREVLLGVAGAGLFTPLWSARILEEWARAAARLHGSQEGGQEGGQKSGQEHIARGEIALLKARWPKSAVEYSADLEASLYLPDENDKHVLAAAMSGKADILLTQNLKDFPTRTLTSHGVIRQGPDGFLCELYQENQQLVGQVAEDVRQVAEQLSGQPQDMRKLMKKARLPRFGKALAAV